MSTDKRTQEELHQTWRVRFKRPGGEWAWTGTEFHGLAFAEKERDAYLEDGFDAEIVADGDGGAK